MVLPVRTTLVSRRRAPAVPPNQGATAPRANARKPNRLALAKAPLRVASAAYCAFCFVWPALRSACVLLSASSLTRGVLDLAANIDGRTLDPVLVQRLLSSSHAADWDIPAGVRAINYNPGDRFP